MLVRDDNYSSIGNYSLMYRRLDTPCNPVALSCGQIVTGQTTNVLQTDAYTITGNTGDIVRLVLSPSLNSGNLSMVAEVFNSSGVALGTFGYYGNLTQLTLTNAGTYTVLVRDDNYSSIGNYSIGFVSLAANCNIAINCGTLVSGLVGSSELKVYRITGATGDVVTVRFSTRSTVSPQWNVSDSNGNILNFIGSGLTAKLTNSGPFYLTILGNGSLVTDYAFVWQKVNQPCNSGALPCGMVQAGTLAANGEVDTYDFTASVGDVIRLRLSSVSPYFVPKMELFDPDGVFVSSIVSETTSTVSKSGKYVVLVSWSGSDNSPIGDYRLSLQRLKSPCAATPLTFGQSAIGVIDDATDVDAYTFSAGPGPISLCLADTSPTLSPVMQLYDSTGVQIASGTTQIQKTITNSGSFSLIVQDSGGTGIGYYNVLLQTGTVSCATIDLLSPVVTNLDNVRQWHDCQTRYYIVTGRRLELSFRHRNESSRQRTFVCLGRAFWFHNGRLANSRPRARRRWQCWLRRYGCAISCD